MKIYKTCAFVLCAIVIAAVFSACSGSASELKDGYYTSEAAAFDVYGWKEFITIYVKGGRILTVEYDAFNQSGFVKSWDLNYMRTMRTATGTYPKEYARIYAVMLIDGQSADSVDAVTGATYSHSSFYALADAAIRQALAGDKRVALVDLSEMEG